MSKWEETEMAPVIEKAVRSSNIGYQQARKRQEERIRALRKIASMRECAKKKAVREKIIENYKKIGLLNDDGSLSSLYYGD